MLARALIGKEQDFEVRDSDIRADALEHLKFPDPPQPSELAEVDYSPLLKTSTTPLLFEDDAEASTLQNKHVPFPSRSALRSPLLAARLIHRIK